MKIVFLSVLVLSLNINAQTNVTHLDGSAVSSASLDTILPRIMKQAGVVGLNITVINKAKPVYERAFGLRDREASLPANTETVFEAASLTKPLFAYLVMTLVKEKVLHLDTPLYKIL